MQIQSITCARTIQIRQYEPHQISATALVGEHENPADVAAALQEFLRDCLWEATGHMRTEFAPRSPQLDLGL